MYTCNMGHFIYHGHIDSQDLSKPGLLLSSGNLTPKKISQHFFPNADIMYLSACSTAETSSEKLVDEVLHLGSGFQLVGFYML
jgi:CHAT domain-containing protein